MELKNMSHAMGQDGYGEFEDEIEYEDTDDVKFNSQIYVLRSEIIRLKDVLMREIKKNASLQEESSIENKKLYLRIRESEINYCNLNKELERKNKEIFYLEQGYRNCIEQINKRDKFIEELQEDLKKEKTKAAEDNKRLKKKISELTVVNEMYFTKIIDEIKKGQPAS